MSGDDYADIVQQYKALKQQQGISSESPCFVQAILM
jgi:hypothetical protein